MKNHYRWLIGHQDRLVVDRTGAPRLMCVPRATKEIPVNVFVARRSYKAKGKSRRSIREREREKERELDIGRRVLISHPRYMEAYTNGRFGIRCYLWWVFSLFLFSPPPLFPSFLIPFRESGPTGSLLHDLSWNIVSSISLSINHGCLWNVIKRRKLIQRLSFSSQIKVVSAFLHIFEQVTSADEMRG